MRWMDDLPVSWDDVPDSVPLVDRGLVQEHLANGQVVRDLERADQFVYARDEVLVDVVA